MVLPWSGRILRYDLRPFHSIPFPGLSSHSDSLAAEHDCFLPYWIMRHSMHRTRWRRIAFGGQLGPVLTIIDPCIGAVPPISTSTSSKQKNVLRGGIPHHRMSSPRPGRHQLGLRLPTDSVKFPGVSSRSILARAAEEDYTISDRIMNGLRIVARLRALASFHPCPIPVNPRA